AIHRGDDGLGTGLESAEHILPSAGAGLREHGTLARKFRDVGTGDERASGTSENDAADRVIDADLVDRMAELGDRSVVESVELVGSVYRQRGDAVRHLERQELEGHAQLYLW